MKRKRLNLFWAFAIITCCLFSCEDDNEVRADTLQDDTEIPVDSVDSQITDSIDEVIGSWYMSEKNAGWGGIHTFSPGKIIYRFYDDGSLSVQDPTEHTVFLSTGMHKYTLDKEKGEITIDSSRYWYRFISNEFIIDTGSAWDAPVYKFKKEDGK